VNKEAQRQLLTGEISQADTIERLRSAAL
jgi:hypothetical protein